MQPAMKAEADESVRMNGIVCSRWTSQIIYHLITLQRSTEQRMNLSIRQMIQRDKVPKFYYVIGNVSYSLVYKDALKSISSKTGALFPRMNQFESQTSFLSVDNAEELGGGGETLQAEVCNGSAPTSYFISGLDNGCLTNSIMPRSSSSSQLAKDIMPLMEEILTLSRGQRQVMHQLDNLCSLIRESSSEERSRLTRMGSSNSSSRDLSIESFLLSNAESSRLPLVLTLALRV
nr:unnamed protein product [Brassica oleracea]